MELDEASTADGYYDRIKAICGQIRVKVFEALQWLRQNNALSRNVTINQLIISKLPEDDVPECLWATMEVSTNVEAAENERASYLPDPLTNASEFNNTTAIPIISSAVLDVNSTKVSSDEVAEHLLERIKAQVPEKTHGKDTEQNSKQDTVYIIPRGNKPANEYSNPNLLLEIFPTLFPYECGGLEDGSRPIQINFLLGGVLGPAKAYFGTVESQGRGSLHLHLLIWLNHEYTPAQLKENIQNQDFRENLLKYLEDIIKEDLDSFRDETNDGTSTTSDTRTLIGEIGSTATEVIPPCRPTPNPALEDFDQTFRKDAVQLVETCNIHKHSAACYKYSKGKNESSKICRRRMPRALVKTADTFGTKIIMAPYTTSTHLW
ncbi:unnamed protein product [Rotaria sp. Silwood1]|nr:unnamed protein product [Rotaria sp. Silwood1]CAF1640440.1 unnamed protein product [Rotaria sp. Silwood1]